MSKPPLRKQLELLKGDNAKLRVAMESCQQDLSRAHADTDNWQHLAKENEKQVFDTLAQLKQQEEISTKYMEEVEKLKCYVCVLHGYSSCPKCVDGWRVTEKLLEEQKLETARQEVNVKHWHQKYLEAEGEKERLKGELQKMTASRNSSWGITEKCQKELNALKSQPPPRAKWGLKKIIAFALCIGTIEVFLYIQSHSKPKAVDSGTRLILPLAKGESPEWVPEDSDVGRAIEMWSNKYNECHSYALAERDKYRACLSDRDNFKNEANNCEMGTR